MRLQPLAFKLHRWLAYAVGLQVVIWVIGGVTFALLPFQDWVKSGASVQKPVVDYPLAAFATIATQAGHIRQVKVFAGPDGPALVIKTADGVRCFGTDGAPLSPVTAASITAQARNLYTGSGSLRDVAQVPASKQLLIVNETAGRDQLWRARFDDPLGTRLYFAPECGDFLFANNNAWVLYDFLWRLHIMDYSGGEDFNTPLLRIFASAALLLALSGGVLAILALRRSLRRRAT